MRRLITLARQVRALTGDEHGHTDQRALLAAYPAVLGVAGVAWALTLPLPFSVLLGIGAIALGVVGCVVVFLRMPAPSIGVRMYPDRRVEQLDPTVESPYSVVWLGRLMELAVFAFTVVVLGALAAFFVWGIAAGAYR